MKKIIFFFLLIITISCKNKEIDHSKDNDTEIQKIGHLYQPEKINTGPVKSDIDLNKKSYEINIYNSDLLEKNMKFLKGHSAKIAILYRNFLIQNEYNYNNIVVRIHQKNNSSYDFKYSEKQLLEIENKRHLNPSENK
ncbi:hypothetical protein [Flavobacterium hibernum]|nr:hypothetical protein [Flavobacterium hibernum]STO14121.1 Uncharacterised protein [Flavobacterium hibernum]